MSPVMFANPELAKAIEIPEALPLDDLRGPEIRFNGKLLGWLERSGGDAKDGKVLPGGFWACDWDKDGSKGVRVPMVVHQPTGSKDRFAKIEHRTLGRIWVLFDDRQGPEWLKNVMESNGM